MARSKNSVSLIGVVGKDAELRQTQQGVHYAQISLATSTGGYKKKDGTDVPEVTQWHRIVVLMTIPQGKQQNVGAAPVQNVDPQQQGVAQPTGGYTQPQQATVPQQPVQQQPTNYQQGGYTQPNTGAPFPPAPEDDLPF